MQIESTAASREHAYAVALGFRLPRIDLNTVPVMSSGRDLNRVERAAAARSLFRSLAIKGISIRAPRYSMAHAVDVRLPRFHEGRSVDGAERIVREILSRAFPAY